MTHLFNATNLNFSEKETSILKNICFSFQAGQIICILGNNGSGKSTLLKVCAGILTPSSGVVTLNNEDIYSLKDEARAKLIGWQPQNINRPYNMSLLEFMDLTPSSHQQELLDLFEVSQFSNKNIDTLSGGEWKRGQLARLWQTNCKVMFLDEPDSDLDLRHKKKLVHYCKDYVQKNNAIMVIVTHDIVFAREVADKICALSDGYLVWNSNSTEFWKTKVINKIFSTKVYS